MKEVETRRSLEHREECLRWKLSVPRVGPIAGPLTVSQKFVRSNTDEFLDITQSYSKQSASEIAKICRSVGSFTSPN